MAKKASISQLSRFLRKPWYLLWGFIGSKFYEGRSYTIQVPQGQRIFTPWYDLEADTEFTSIYKRAKKSEPMAVSLDRSYFLYQMAKHSLNVFGDMAECGVYKGGTAYLIASVIASETQSKRKLHLFDTFEGMPDSSEPERDYHSPGDFSDTSLQKVQTRLSEYTSLCQFYPGFIPDTFVDLPNDSTYSFVHVDVDIYPSVMECCKYFWPRLSVGGTIVFDDYGFYPYRYAARAAVDEYFAKQSQKPITLPTGQAFIIKTDSGQ